MSTSFLEKECGVLERGILLNPVDVIMRSRQILGMWIYWFVIAMMLAFGLLLGYFL
jgi:hypothetical protein